MLHRILTYLHYLDALEELRAPAARRFTPLGDTLWTVGLLLTTILFLAGQVLPLPDDLVYGVLLLLGAIAIYAILSMEHMHRRAARAIDRGDTPPTPHTDELVRNVTISYRQAEAELQRRLQAAVEAEQDAPELFPATAERRAG